MSYVSKLIYRPLEALISDCKTVGLLPANSTHPLLAPLPAALLAAKEDMADMADTVEHQAVDPGVSPLARLKDRRPALTLSALFFP